MYQLAEMATPGCSPHREEPTLGLRQPHPDRVEHEVDNSNPLAVVYVSRVVDHEADGETQAQLPQDLIKSSQADQVTDRELHTANRHPRTVWEPLERRGRGHDALISITAGRGQMAPPAQLASEADIGHRGSTPVESNLIGAF